MLKISAVFGVTVALAGLLAFDMPGFSASTQVASADSSVVRVKTISIRPSILPTLVTTFEPSTHWQSRPSLRRKSSRVAALY